MNPINQMTMNQMAMARYGLQPNPASYVHPAQAGYAAAALIHGQGTRKNATRESTQQLKILRYSSEVSFETTEKPCLRAKKPITPNINASQTSKS